ncbi:hypothetical protein [Sphingosinicella sp.]|uniref:hypothetical protein n=1 Tax=Sphingosinicella sp. TaxID=1917971 RepID=UPI004037FB4A
MADQRALDAIARIERALARIETAAARPAPVDRSEEQRLHAAHDALRSRVSGALAQLDALIASGERR